MSPEASAPAGSLPRFQSVAGARSPFGRKVLDTRTRTAGMGRLLFVTGLVLAAVGALLWLAEGRLGWFGKLPGDVRVDRSGWSFSFPFVSMLLLSLILTLLLNLF